jgi:MFS family permease
VLLSLFGATAGQAVVWYTGQFYALFFLTQTLKIDAETANWLIAGALLAGTPFFIIFGSLSDKIGRKPIVMLGCVIAALTYFPVFKGIAAAGNPDLYAAQAKAPVSVVADPASCSFQFDPVGKAKFTSSCDIAKTTLAKKSVAYVNVPAAAGAVSQIKVGDVVIDGYESAGLSKDDLKAKSDAFNKALGGALKDAGYPDKADPAKIDKLTVWLLLTLLVIYVTMVYGPIAAWLVELFPARIRYTSMSLPYHIGNGWFGGFLPTTAFAMVAATGDVYYGLWYPIVVAVVTVIVGTLFLPETKDRDIHHT